MSATRASKNKQDNGVRTRPVRLSERAYRQVRDSSKRYKQTMGDVIDSIVTNFAKLPQEQQVGILLDLNSKKTAG